MENFKSTYKQKCTELGVEPLQGVLSTLVPSVLAPTQPDSSTAQARTSYHPHELILSGQPIGLKGVKALSSPLQTDVIFTRLVLADAFLGDDGIIILADALKSNATLEYLDIRGNSIRCDGAIALGTMLKVNSTLKALYIEWNCVGVFESGMHALAESLSFNQTLKCLDLRNNKITGAGATMLARSLRHNTSLAKLDLRWNSIGTGGARAFLDTLKVNISLQEVELTGNDISEDTIRAITASLSKNAERNKIDLESRSNTNLLSSALQSIASEHAQTVNELSGKLVETEHHAKTLSSKLQTASDEIAVSHDAYKTLLNKLEVLQRQKSDMEASLMQERKEFTVISSNYQRDLLTEREKRMTLENKLEQSTRAVEERILALEAKIRDSELTAEVLRRDKKVMLSELEDSRSKELTLNNLYKEKIQELESQYHSKLLQLQDSKDKDFLEKSKSFQSRIRDLEEHAGENEKSMNAWKARWNAERQTMLQEMDDTESRARQEEEHKRRELVKQLDMVVNQRNALQNELQTTGVKYSQLLKEQELENVKFQNQRLEMNDQLSGLKIRMKEIVSFEQKYAEIEPELKRYREKAGALALELESVKGTLAQKDALNARLKEELRRQEAEFEEMDQENAVKMKELQLNVMSLLNLQPKRHRIKSGNILDGLV